MAQDWWVHEWVDALRQARTPLEIQALIDRLEDHYDAFSGPGQDLIEDLLAQARRRLKETLVS
jgi:hypothetical protein